MKFILNGTAEIMFHPARFKILQTLKERGPAFVDQISKATGVNPRMVSHHLDVLEGQKLIESKYELNSVQGSKRGVAVRVARITEKAQDALKDIRESAK